MNRRMWHVWPGQWWPSLLEQEQEFIETLRLESSGKTSRFDRDDVTALVNALRCGTDFDTFMSVAPGAKLNRILAAYETLEARRATAADAWLQIEAEPSAKSLRRHADDASLLLGNPVRRMLSVLELSIPNAVAEAAAEAAAQVHRMQVLAHGIETELAALEPQDPHGIELGVRLFSPHTPGVYNNQYYLPDRLSAVSPIRLSALLGEAP